MALATITIHSDQRDLGPFAVTAPTLDALNVWLHTGKGRAYSVNVAMPPKLEDEANRIGVVTLLRDHVLGFTVEGARLGPADRII